MTVSAARGATLRRVKLPNAAHAIVDIEKLRDYCLNQKHPRGRHKARVFMRRLGLSAADASVLRSALLAAARLEEVTLGTADIHGSRYVLDFEFKGPRGAATIRSHWIIRRGERAPRMTSCYVR